jgi:hypothetical protein
MKGVIFLAIVLASASIHAFAGDGKVVENPVASDSNESFEKQSAWVHVQMQPGGIYEHISGNDKTRVDQRLGDMKKLLEARAAQPVDSWPESEKIALFNAQEEVNGILRHNDNNRLVCERRAPVGSNLPVTTCHTYGELAQSRSSNQKALTDWAQRVDQARTAVKAPGGN